MPAGLLQNGPMEAVPMRLALRLSNVHPLAPYLQRFWIRWNLTENCTRSLGLTLRLTLLTVGGDCLLDVGRRLSSGTLHTHSHASGYTAH